MSTRISVIIGSTRPNRFSEKPARWLFEELKKKEGVEAELLDLRDYPMPFFNEAITPSAAKGTYTNEVVVAWGKKIAAADAYIVVAPEYNHGYPAVLKNAFDWLYYEWNKKPIAFASYGSAAGARGIEQMREVAIELQMAPIRAALHIMPEIYAAASKTEGYEADAFAPIAPRAQSLFEQLLWWAQALKEAREKKI